MLSLPIHPLLDEASIDRICGLRPQGGVKLAFTKMQGAGNDFVVLDLHAASLSRSIQRS